MAKVTVSGAARLVGMSRQYLYKAYIHPGKISIERDASGKPLVDTSELIRVFGELKGNVDLVDDSESLHQETTDNDSVIEVLRAQLEAKDELLSRLEQQIRTAEEREIWLRQQLERAQAVLVDQRPKERRWWKIW
ncbi:hypothetical protein MQE22_13715 (plasmid) [Acidithiobacillus sp. YTS05]|nr:hypothetical protein MQE22_13715 [Acidithiobacillus sp. YTS05]